MAKYRLNENKSQRQFLVDYLRGSGRTLTPTEANKKFKIQKLGSRMSELRSVGLQITKQKMHNETSYGIGALDKYGSRKKLLV